MAALCTSWVTVEEVADCCTGLVGSDFDLFEESAEVASDLLFELSAKQYPGLCERTVRPCTVGPVCGVQLLSRGHVVTWDGSVWAGPADLSCSCTGLSRIELPNYPIRSIIKVLIDGVEEDPAGYRLDGMQYLTRMRDADGERQVWPACQALDLPSTEEGTFEVTYIFGQEVPVAGQLAAAELACQIYQACPSSGASGATCRLPSGVVRETRQGVTIELDKLRAWGYATASVARGGRSPGWNTGLPLVDAFLNAKNPNGLRRPPLIWSPDEVTAEEVGTTLGS